MSEGSARPLKHTVEILMNKKDVPKANIKILKKLFIVYLKPKVIVGNQPTFKLI